MPVDTTPVLPLSTPSEKPGRRIGFVSTRLYGTDGVSLEAQKWATILQRLGHTCFYWSGMCDRPAALSVVVPEAFFGHPDIEEICTAAFENGVGTPDGVSPDSPDLRALHATVFSGRFRPPALTTRILELATHLKRCLYTFVQKFEIELLVVENALSLPMHLPLGLALTELIAETGLPTLAHHHDFYWERKRFLVNCVPDYLNMAFPPDLPSIRHVVINSLAARQLSRRTGISAMVIPNVMDFANPHAEPDDYASKANVRADLGLAEQEYFILQPTRVIPRKGIEHAIELTRRLGLPARLVVTHASGDEGYEYEQRLREYAALLRVPVNFVYGLVDDQRGHTDDGRKIYTLGDVYAHADLVTYPSQDEGFGNAFLEALYFRRPIVVNNYTVFAVDIKRNGFRVIEFEDYITEQTVRLTRDVLLNPELAEAMASTNYELAQRHYSYAVAQRRLQTLIADLLGEEVDSANTEQIVNAPKNEMD